MWLSNIARDEGRREGIHEIHSMMTPRILLNIHIINTLSAMLSPDGVANNQQFHDSPRIDVEQPRECFRERLFDME